MLRRIREALGGEGQGAEEIGQQESLRQHPQKNPATKYGAKRGAARKLEEDGEVKETSSQWSTGNEREVTSVPATDENELPYNLL
jgi:hypothetical protein